VTLHLDCPGLGDASLAYLRPLTRSSLSHSLHILRNPRLRLPPFLQYSPLQTCLLTLCTPCVPAVLNRWTSSRCRYARDAFNISLHTHLHIQKLRYNVSLHTISPSPTHTQRHLDTLSKHIHYHVHTNR
jgi:hypothetical protein